MLSAAVLLAGCTSEKSRIEKLISKEIQNEPLKLLPAGSSVKNVSASVTAQSGLEFTSKAEVVVALPKLYQPIDPELAVANDIRNGLEKDFAATASGKSAELVIPQGEFESFVRTVTSTVSPAFVQVAPEGYTIHITYPGIDGRRSGESVRFERIVDPKIDWGSKSEEIKKSVASLPQDAKVYADSAAFVSTFQKEFASQLSTQADALRSKLNEQNSRKLKLIAGRWEGQAHERMVDQTHFTLKINFAADGACSGRLSEESIISGIGVSEIKEDMDFTGTWKSTSAGLEITAKQKRWFFQGKQLQGPGSDKPGSAREEKVSQDDFVLKMSLVDGQDQMTWMPIGSKIENATGGKIIALVPLVLSKTQTPESNPEPAPAAEKPKTPIKVSPAFTDVSELPSQNAEATAPAPLNPQQAPEPSHSNAGSPESLPPAEISDAPPTPDPQPDSSAKKLKPIASLDDFATFTPTTPSENPPSKTVFPDSSGLPGEKFPETRLRQLTPADVQNWTLAKVRYALNEMYARHGLTFKDKDIQKQFSQFKWYRPAPAISSSDIETGFTEIEGANKLLLIAARQVMSSMPQTAMQNEPGKPSVKVPSVIYSPTDKLPQDIAGKGVAGDFLLVGTDMQGRLQLIAQSDRMNPFPRKFTITNDGVRDNPGVVLLIRDYRPFSVSRSAPLILIGRDSAPGVYYVRSQLIDK